MVSAFSSNFELAQVVSFNGRFIASFYLTVLFSIFIFLKGALSEILFISRNGRKRILHPMLVIKEPPFLLKSKYNLNV